MDIVQEFNTTNCPTLAGKPKIFLFQACRGLNLDKGLRMNTESTDGGRTIHPDLSNMLFIYPTAPGYATWRNHKLGAWYVQEFCQVMEQLSHSYHMMDILTEVNRRVSETHTSSGGFKQMPAPVSMLTSRAATNIRFVRIFA